MISFLKSIIGWLALLALAVLLLLFGELDRPNTFAAYVCITVFVWHIVWNIRQALRR